jgi:hypothetical protein
MKLTARGGFPMPVLILFAHDGVAQAPDIRFVVIG